MKQPSVEGFLLLEPSLRLIYISPGAIDILLYPQESAKIAAMEKVLDDRIRSVLLKQPSSPRSGFVSEFKSGKRRYYCRAFSLNSQESQSSEEPRIAVLIERSRRVSFDGSELAARYNLTDRERETVEFLAKGFTSKEIAARMKISPNTVKAFLRLIMVKMGTTTRSGIIAKILEPNDPTVE